MPLTAWTSWPGPVSLASWPPLPASAPRPVHGDHKQGSAGTCMNPHHPSSTHSMLPSRASLTALDGRGTHAGRVTPEQLRLQATDWICRAL